MKISPHPGGGGARGSGTKNFQGKACNNTILNQVIKNAEQLKYLFMYLMTLEETERVRSVFLGTELTSAPKYSSSGHQQGYQINKYVYVSFKMIHVQTNYLH